ncbi:carbohydrate-binding protein [Actinospica sp. MGRD01-02]|uniref:Carbohydrate-binding protein n=1 Tax=Actinospica acidithermotolerans TaxID=2828514 RepID=A0A941E5Z1_9ACTN|nr:carbohydrate-binding protein [Actinospica acidithermotolerans]MBR7825741.1 carbohydrate-binding protein [Actinospica acidithermotolerans]
MRFGKRMLKTALMTSSAAGLLAGGSILAVAASAPAAQAATTCAAAWSSTAVYTAGNQASENGINYTANWWTQGNDPATNNGGSGSGQPWTSNGACTGGTSTGGTSTGGSGTGTGSGGTGTGSTSGLLFSPYKDVTINMNWNTYQMQSAVEGSAIPVVGSGSLVSQYIPKLPALTVAFATGTCGSETWGGASGATWAAENVPQLQAANLNYVISTGGAAGTFTCASTSGMESFIARYASPNLVGVDFDIEGGQSASDIQNLVAAAAGAQAEYPKLQFSFTLATLGASDGSYGGVNSLGNEVVQAVLGSGLSNYVINLMTMDYGNASSSVCVVSNGSCEMALSAEQAVTNLEHTYGIPASKIAVTPMIGMNDATSEVFTAADVDTLSSYAVSNGLAGLHFWSLDRDTPCSDTYASPTCNSVSSTTALEYTNKFLTDLGD